MTEEEKLSHKSEVYRFLDCVLDADRRELRLAGETVTLQPKAFEFLLYLIRNRSRAIDKDELQDALWPRSIVTETALTRVVMKARRAVADDADRQAVIRTVHGHGYRFVADLLETGVAGADMATPVAPTESAAGNTSKLRAIAATIVLVSVISVVWWYLSPSAISGPVRLAVLPVENATGNAEWDWVETGFMALMNRMLEDRGVEVVGGRSVTGLAGDLPQSQLIAADSEFQQALFKTTAFTHLLAARLEHENGLYRLSYTFFHGDDRPQRRTIVDQQPTELIAQAIATVATMVKAGAPSLGSMRIVSDDSFLNEAFARGMSLQHEGRCDEARQLYQVIMEQEPDLFWPRYEYALCTRNLREYDKAEQQLRGLIDELDDGGASHERASANNALGVMYNSQRNHELAKKHLDEALRVAQLIDRTDVAATARINLALTARNQGDQQTSYDELMNAAELYRSRDIDSLPGALLNNLSGVLISLGRLEEAQKNSLQAIETFRLTGQRLYESYALSRLSDVQQRLGLLEDAERNAASSMAIREELGDRRGVAISLIYLSRIQITRGNLARARSYGEQIQEIGAEIDDKDLIMAGYQQVAYADERAHRANDALEQFRASEALAVELEDRSNVLESRAGMARAFAALGNFDAALALADELIRAAETDGMDNERADALNILSIVRIEQQEWSAAIESLTEALRIATAAGDAETIATSNELLGKAYLELGDVESARTSLLAASFARPNEARITVLRARLAEADGDAEEALRIMNEARTRAGEGWTEADATAMERYRAAVNAMDPVE